MTDERARRAERRRALDWEYGTARSHADLQQTDDAWWAALSPGQRLEACFDVSRDAWSIRAEEPSDDGSDMPFGVRPYGSDEPVSGRHS